MKKLFILFIMFTVCLITVKAQSKNLRFSKTDTIKTTDDLAQYLKERSVISPLTRLKIDSPVFTYRGDHKDPFTNGIRLNLKINETVAENMPIAKLSSANKMPVLKLGDTETTHFTMMIKPLEGLPGKSKTLTP